MSVFCFCCPRCHRRAVHCLLKFRIGGQGGGSDARRRLIHLTEKGAEQQALLQRSFLDVEEAMVRGFTQEERENLCALLDRVIQNLKEESET